MVGRALVLSRLHTIGKMGQLTARCMGNQLCRNMGQWIARNPDCALGVIQTLASYGTTGAPSVTTMTGATTVGLDAASVGIDCFDKIPGTKLSVVEAPSGISNFRYGQPTRDIKFRDKTVHQYDELIDPNRIDEDGLTNLERMKLGWAPYGPDGEKIVLHHHLQQDAGPMHEVPGTYHGTGETKSELHPVPRGVPSQINRSAGKTWRENYWKQRACDFGGC
jgi:filamentous hemagglutinin